MGGSQSRRKRLSITQEGLDHSGRVLFTEIVSLCVALWKPHPVSPGLFCGERVSQPRLSSVKQPCSRNRGHSCLTPSSSNPHPADSVLGRHLSSRSPGVFGLKAGHPWTPWDKLVTPPCTLGKLVMEASPQKEAKNLGCVGCRGPLLTAVRP